jgi:hypothetical protein
LGVALLANLLPASAAETNAAFSYLAYRFGPDEGWHLRGSGDLGATKLDGRVLQFDFTKGAAAIALGLPDRVLLGRPEKLRLRVRGSVKGHSVRVQLRTHFMTFEKFIGELSGEGDQELVFDAPPGSDWKWFGGENDGKIHGPLRLGEIRFEAGAAKDAGRLELLGLAMDGTCPSNRLCMMVASTKTRVDRTAFVAEVRAASRHPLPGELKWSIRDWDGNQLAGGDLRVSVPAGGEPLPLEVPGPRFPEQLKFAETEFSLEIPGQVVPKVQACWLAPQTPHDDPELRPESPFGMSVYLKRFRGADQAAVARAARDAGVKWSREDFGWGQIEREPGKFDWTFHDRLVATARANGITIYAIVLGFPPWCSRMTSATTATTRSISSTTWAS